MSDRQWRFVMYPQDGNDPAPLDMLFGKPTFEVTATTTTYPTPGEDARRIVRHGMSDVLRWLGEPVGKKPGEPTTTVTVIPNASITTREQDAATHARNLAALKHEAETPLRGHDADGSCCRAALETGGER